MVKPIDEIELAWSSLHKSDDASGWRSIPIQAAGPCPLRAGRIFPQGDEALLAGFSTGVVPVAEKLPDGQGFFVSRVNPEGDPKTWLALTRKTHGSLELFGAMVVDVVNVLRDGAAFEEKQLLHIYLGRIRAWQEFMRKGAQALSPEAEIGLVGELIILRSIVEFDLDPAVALSSWGGPLDKPQDFEIGSGAIETKATLASRGFPAKIGSLDQLDDSIRQPLFIAGVRLKQVESGRTLPEFVRDVHDVFAGSPELAQQFTNRLLDAGYSAVHANQYHRRFAISEIRVIEVDSGFPRLTVGSVPPGVTKAQYEIDLDSVPASSDGIIGALKKLGVI